MYKVKRNLGGGGTFFYCLFLRDIVVVFVVKSLPEAVLSGFDGIVLGIDLPVVI